jgi:primary-amine oxidase
MPVETIHLFLEPDGFFDRNPALDIPDPAATADGSTCCS